MTNTNLLDNLSNFYLVTKKNLRNIYQKSNIYDKKISRVNKDSFGYKPSPHLLSSVIKYQKKNIKLMILL